jgi:hypothetical protein
MIEIDEIWSCNDLKCGTYKIFDTFWLININGDEIIRQKKIPLKTRSFLSLVLHLKKFGPAHQDLSKTPKAHPNSSKVFSYNLI